MRQLVSLVGVMLLAAVTAAQSQAPAPVAPAPTPAVTGEASEDITQGQFAQLVLRAIATKQHAEAPDLTPEQALERIKELQLVPAGWHADWLLTQRDLAAVLVALGIDYVPMEPTAPVSRAFAEAILRRHQLQFEQYGQMKFTHGQAAALVTDEGVDRAVSPSQF